MAEKPGAQTQAPKSNTATGGSLSAVEELLEKVNGIVGSEGKGYHSLSNQAKDTAISYQMP